MRRICSQLPTNILTYAESFHERSKGSRGDTHYSSTDGGRRLRIHEDSRGNGQYVDDTVITTKVKAAILEEPV
jgi:osmotically-inducible protein OsmY